MKSLVEFIKESSDTVYVVYDKQDGSIVGVGDTEDDAKKVASEYENGNSDFKTEIKSEKRSEIEK